MDEYASVFNLSQLYEILIYIYTFASNPMQIKSRYRNLNAESW